MRDPMSWALRLPFRVSGIPIKIHLLFFLITIPLFLRVAWDKGNPVWWGDIFLFTIVMLFGIILLHELGHCFGARAVGGEAKEVLIWPLGGLAYNEVPHNARANFIVAAAGPFVNVLICLVCATGLLIAGFVPNLNPISDPYLSEMYRFKDDRTYTSEYGLRLYKKDTAERVPGPQEAVEKLFRDAGLLTMRAKTPPEFNAKFEAEYEKQGVVRALAPGWAVWFNRTFWLSWVLFLFNLIPAYPLDGGQMLQSLIWGRTDYRRGVVVASYSGYAFGVLFLAVSIWQNESLFMGLGLFMLYMSWAKLYALEAEEAGAFGYDFSAGYTSLERDDEPPPKPKRPGFFARWWQARKARKLARDREQRQRDEDRKEALLEKIALSGMGSLTDEEKRFLAQFSTRYRPRS